MKTIQVCAFLCCICLVTSSALAFSDDSVAENNNSIQKEIAELGQLVRELTARLSKLEERSEMVEKRGARATTVESFKVSHRS